MNPLVERDLRKFRAWLDSYGNGIWLVVVAVALVAGSYLLLFTDPDLVGGAACLVELALWGLILAAPRFFKYWRKRGPEE